jgi:hypothetical protein
MAAFDAAIQEKGKITMEQGNGVFRLDDRVKPGHDS